MGDKRAAPEKLDAWKALRKHQKEFGPVHMRDLFAKDKKREQRFAADACGIRLEAADAHEGDIGYELSPEHWGRGYATEAARAAAARRARCSTSRPQEGRQRGPG